LSIRAPGFAVSHGRVQNRTPGYTSNSGGFSV
jgi:hypothetical protein